MSYMKRYLEWAVEKLEKSGFGTWNECMEYMQTTCNEDLPSFVTMQAYVKELKKH